MRFIFLGLTALMMLACSQPPKPTSYHRATPEPINKHLLMSDAFVEHNHE